MQSTGVWGDECALGAFAPACEEEMYPEDMRGLAADQLELPPGLGDEEIFLPPGLSGVDDQDFYLNDTAKGGSGLFCAGHAATGEWAWRTAPRPQEARGLEREPLVVRLGGAPDGSALLEAAVGLGGMEDLPRVLHCC